MYMYMEVKTTLHYLEPKGKPLVGPDRTCTGSRASAEAASPSALLRRTRRISTIPGLQKYASIMALGALFKEMWTTEYLAINYLGLQRYEAMVALRGFGPNTRTPKV